LVLTSFFDNNCRFVCHLMTGNVSEVITLMLGLAFVDADGISVYPLSTLQVGSWVCWVCLGCVWVCKGFVWVCLGVKGW
jgi:hypothetical protein